MSLRPIRLTTKRWLSAKAAHCHSCDWTHSGREAKRVLRRHLHRYPAHSASLAQTRVTTYTGETR